MKDRERREFSREGHCGSGKVREEGEHPRQREGTRPSSLQGRWPQEAAPSLGTELPRRSRAESRAGQLREGYTGQETLENVLRDKLTN